jgi:hypothetical protein
VARPVDEQIAAVARRQNGNVSRTQLLALGVSPSSVAYRCKIGRLHREHLGVYAVGRPARTWLEKASAAVLACGRGAALCHYSALTLWELESRWSFPLHVCSPDCRARPGIVTHRLASLAKGDLRTHNNVRATSPARTVLDCTPTLTDGRLKRIVADGRRSRSRRLSLAQLRDVVVRFPNHPGAARLGALIGTDANPTRSPFEDDFQVFCEHHGLPTPVVNTPVCGREVDAWFPEERLIVELDGWDFHNDRDSFEQDRDHDAAALSQGIPTVRVTWERVHERPVREAARLHRILANRRR